MQKHKQEFEMIRIVLLLVAAYLPLNYCKIEIEMQRFEQLGATSLIDATNLRIRKYNRTSPVLNGTILIHKDLNNFYEGSMKVFYSRLGNNQFNEYPLKWSPKPFCHMLNDSYRDLQHIFLNHSNFPQVSDEGLCPFPQGTYWFNNAMFPTEFIPQIVQNGYWRMSIMVNDDVHLNLYTYVKNTLT
ncbi:uncharacterized protein LOC131682109 [Topomyia yanbarensis]|uniref:uncharacterized protein LOC131682109 n=1 Tax=Topomyia yanbarensis TaxID=2498891 RepID=UPI00273B7D8F|nr:uncharacterized protein LOC131682109 [Topomyia yanbarensis]